MEVIDLDSSPPVFEFGVHCLTAPFSNTGKSLGDVFLSLLAHRWDGRKTAFLTHPVHLPIVQLFSRRLHRVLLTRNADAFCRLYQAQNAHACAAPSPPPLFNPWGAFIWTGTVPDTSWLTLEPIEPDPGEPDLILFPDRSDKKKSLTGAEMEAIAQPFVAAGRKVHVNCAPNEQATPVSGGSPLTLTMLELVAHVRKHRSVVVGLRSGIFDLLYFLSNSPLVALYPPGDPEWVWNCRLDHPELARYPALLPHRRPKVFDIRKEPDGVSRCAEVVRTFL